MPYRLIHFAPGLVQVEVSGHIVPEDVTAIRTEGEMMLRHVTEAFDAIVDATHFTGLNPSALAGLRELPLPPQLRAVAVILGGWQRLASRALPPLDGLVFVGSVTEAYAALADAPPLAVARGVPAETPELAHEVGGVQAVAPELAREVSGAQPVAKPAPAPQPAPEPLPQVRRLPARPLPPSHRRPAPVAAARMAEQSADGLAGAVLRGLARRLNHVSERLEQIRDW